MTQIADTPCKRPVTDAAVTVYVDSVRSGGPISKAFEGPLKECEFTPAQRHRITEARRFRKAKEKSQSHPLKLSPSIEPPPAIEITVIPIPKIPKMEAKSCKPLNKLQRILLFQHGRCFYCGEELSESQASIEHLLAKKLGGKSEEWNEVVCHKTMNAAFGAMDLRNKFAYVIKAAGKLRCPV